MILKHNSSEIVNDEEEYITGSYSIKKNSSQKKCMLCELAPLIFYIALDGYMLVKHSSDIRWIANVMLVGLIYLLKGYEKKPVLKHIHIGITALTLISLFILNY